MADLDSWPTVAPGWIRHPKKHMAIRAQVEGEGTESSRATLAQLLSADRQPVELQELEGEHCITVRGESFWCQLMTTGRWLAQTSYVELTRGFWPNCEWFACEAQLRYPKAPI